MRFPPFYGSRSDFSQEIYSFYKSKFQVEISKMVSTISCLARNRNFRELKSKKLKKIQIQNGGRFNLMTSYCASGNIEILGKQN